MRRLLSLGWIRRGIIGGALGVMVLAAGCSALKLGYRQGPSLVGFWLDNQFDLDNAQTARLKEELHKAFEWHQRTQLPAYAQQLAGLRSEAAAGATTGAQVCRWQETARDLAVRSLEHVLPAAAELALTLTPAQIQHFDRKQTRRTAELRDERLPADAAKRHRAMTERTVKRFEDFYGRLSAAQRRLLDEGLAASPFDLEDGFKQREQRQRELVTELRRMADEKPSAAQVQERLRRVLRRYDGRDPMGSREQAAAIAEYHCDMAARLHNSTTAEQRRHLAEKLQGWEDDARSLAREVIAAALADAPPTGSGR